MSASTADKQEILRVRAEFVPAFNAGDFDEVVSTFADDVLIVPPDREAFVSRTAARAMWGELEGVRGLRMEHGPVARVDVDGDLGYSVGCYYMHVDTPDGTITHYGRSLEVWRRQADGSWKLVADMWHDLPDGTTPADLTS